MAERAACVAVSLAVALLLAGDLGGLHAMAQPALPSDAAEIPTDGRRVEAVGRAPFGAIGAVLQIIVVMACPVICFVIGFLGRYEGRKRQGSASPSRAAHEEGAQTGFMDQSDGG